MALIAMLTGIAIMSVDRANTDMTLSSNQLQEEKAFYLAEAGSARAVVEINKDDGWRSGYYKQVLEGGNYTVKLIDSLVDPTLVDTVIFDCEGIYFGGKAKMETWLVPTYIYPFEYAMFADGGISIMQGSCTDSYNSDSGTYVDTKLTDGGNVGTNDTLILSQDAFVGGDAQTAIPGSIIMDSSATITGDTTTQADSVNLDIIPQSEYDWAKTVSNAPAGFTGVDYDYNNGRKSLNIRSGGALMLQSGVYYFSDIQLQQNAVLTLAPGAEVTIYMTGDLTIQQYATVNLGGSPADLLIFSQGTAFSMFQNTAFYGAFYGPNATFKGRQDQELYGSIVASDISLHQNTCFHYDRYLSQVRHGTTGEMVVVAWRQPE
jgi:hypothetical protein